MDKQSTSGAVYHAMHSEQALASEASGGTDRSHRWQRWDVNIDNVLTSPNRFDVTEDQYIVVERGTYHRIYRTISLSNLVSLGNIRVFEDDVPLPESAMGEAGTYTVSMQSDSDKPDSGRRYQKITINLRSAANPGDTRHLRLSYSVNGALRSYQSGDQLIWPALPTHRDYSIGNATVRVVMPSYRPPTHVSSYPNTWQLSRGGNTLTWQSPRGLGKLNGFQARIEYPHDPQMQAPPWQGTSVKMPVSASKRRPFIGCAIFIAMVLACLGLMLGGTFLHGYNSCMGVEGGAFMGCVSYGFHSLSSNGYSSGSTYVDLSGSTVDNSSSSGSFTSSSSDSSGSSSSASGSDSSSSSDSGGDGGDAGGD